MERALQNLLDEAAIKKIHLRYCRGIDRRDYDLVRSCFHPDAIDNHGHYVGDIEGFIKSSKVGITKYESTTHFTTNQLVEVHGDTAWAEHYGLSYLRIAAGPDGPAKDVITVNRWIDRMERRNGEWRIAKRVVIIDMDRVDPVIEHWAGARLFARGACDKSDPSYER